MSTPRRHVTFRLPDRTARELDERAREAGTARNTLAERYIAEGLRLDEHPLIRFRDGALGRRAALVGTRLDVWQVVETLRANGNSLRDTAEYLGCAETLVRASIRYYAAYGDEVDDFAARATAAAERAEQVWRAEQEILAG